MFRKIRLEKQALSPEGCIEALNRGTSGVLAVSGDENYPYAVPLSYLYHGGKIIFHCAVTGHKLDAIARNNKVSFCVIDQDVVVPKDYTTHYRSVIVFGKARVLDDADEKRDAMKMLAAKYFPGDIQGTSQYIDKAFDRFCVVEIAIEHITGKEAEELLEKG